MIPDTTNPCWRRVLTSESDLSDAVLATKLLVTRLRHEVKAQPGSLGPNIAELRAYFQKNISAVRDIALF